MNTIQKAISFLTRPFREDLKFFMLQCYLAAAYLAVEALLLDCIHLALKYCVLAALICYFITLISSALKGKAKKFYQLFFYILAALNTIADIVLYTSTGSMFGSDKVGFVVGTNPSESAEFMLSYFNPAVLVRAALCISGYYMLSNMLDKIKIKGLVLPCIAALLLTGAAVGTHAAKSPSWDGIYLGKVLPFFQYEPSADLQEYRHPIPIEAHENAVLPNDITIIIGESFSKKESSLYGCPRETNPLLSGLRDSSRLYVYDNVEAAATHTIEAFMLFMSTFSTDSPVEYYECTDAFDIIKARDYHSAWISNQSRAGAFDNLVTTYADLADTSAWTSQEIAGIQKYDFDQAVLPVIDSISANSGDGRRITFVHLTGSHESFKMRYPQEFARFTEEDMEEYYPKQRPLLAEYDNSVLYNDYVVYSIMKKKLEGQSIVIYFSDHGLDLYDSDPMFCGHSKDVIPASVKAAKQIPFMVCMSPKFERAFPDLARRIRRSTGNEFNTADFIYTLADIMGIDALDGVSVADKTLFK